MPDTEETKSTGLLNRLIAEQQRPRADVFWSGDPVRAAILKAKGVSAAYKSPAADGLPTQYSDADHHWISFSARARVLIYNKNLVPDDQIPTSIHDLAAARFKGKACLANPLFGTTSMHAAALFQVLGDDDAKKFFQSLVDKDVKILSSNGEVRRRVANGEFAIGLTDTDDVNVAIQEGKPVGFVFPDADGMGTLIVPNAAVLIARCPHPEQGRRFIDYLLRPETLSGGQQQRVALARALATPPKLLLLDEPLGGLDLITKQTVLKQIAELKSKLGFAVVLVTHDPVEVRGLCDSLAVLEDGRIAEHGSLEKVASSAQTELGEAIATALKMHDHLPSAPS